MLVTGIQASTAAGGHVYALSRRLRRSPFEREPFFKLPGPPAAAPAPQADASDVLEPSGSRAPPPAGATLAVGRTGLSVTISNLSIPPAETRQVMEGRTYRLPAFTPDAHARLQGTPGHDTIKVTQDKDGNTVVEAAVNGASGAVNLGRIAALEINNPGGNNIIHVHVDNYYGGVTVNGGDGDDRIDVQAGEILHGGLNIRGGAGADTITLSGQALRTMIMGDAGNDLIDARALQGGNHTTRLLDGGEGHDIIYGAPGGNTILGGAGDDLLVGGAGDDRLIGGDGNDVIRGVGGANIIRAGAGNDTVYGGDGNDLIFGDAGDNLLLGGAGDDRLIGGSGTNRLYGGGGRNILQGGAGPNTFAPTDRDPADIRPLYRTADYLAVMTRQGLRRQPLIEQYQSPANLILNYQSGRDYLVDSRLIDIL